MTPVNKCSPNSIKNVWKINALPSQDVTLQIVVWLLQTQKTVQIEKLAALLSIPIKYESPKVVIQYGSVKRKKR